MEATNIIWLNLCINVQQNNIINAQFDVYTCNCYKLLAYIGGMFNAKNTAEP